LALATVSRNAESSSLSFLSLHSASATFACTANRFDLSSVKRKHLAFNSLDSSGNAEIMPIYSLVQAQAPPTRGLRGRR
jgi:hypothetical protein